MQLVPITSDGPKILVSNSNELLDAYLELSTQIGGGTILLESGYYGSHSLYGSFGSDEPVVMVSADPHNPAEFEAISLHNVSNVRIEDVHINSTSNGSSGSSLINIASGSTNIQIVGVEVNGKIDGTYDGHYGVHISNSSNVGVYDLFIHDVKNGIVVEGSDGIQIAGNSLEWLGNDGMKFSGVSDVLIEDNFGPRFVYPEDGAHLDFIQFQGADSNDIVIVGNVLLPENWTNLQGIFMDDAHYTNVLIEQNIIVTGMLRGISVSSGTNVVARENTVLDLDGYGSKATSILVDGESYGNIQSSYLQDTGEGINLILQQTHYSEPLHYDDVFVNADVGLGITLADLIPTVNSLAYEYGATERLAELLSSSFDPIAEGPQLEDPIAEGPPLEDPIAEGPPLEDPIAEGPPLEDPIAKDPGNRGNPPESVAADYGSSSFLSELIDLFLSIFGLGGDNDNPVLAPRGELSESVEFMLSDVVPTVEPLGEDQPEAEVDELDFAA